ncbi:MAG: lipoyl synthase [Armatimonadota bacterium]
MAGTDAMQPDGGSAREGGIVNQRIPRWLVPGAPKRAALERMDQTFAGMALHTVCQSAQCPNVGECFGKGAATFMILGDSCTRDCRFCAVQHGRPELPDPDEPRRVAEAAAMLGLSHVVVTSVTRDDLADGGAAHFASTIHAIRDLLPTARVEVLVPDFRGDGDALRSVIAAGPDVLNHNVETVPRLYQQVRPQADYRRSLALLRRAALMSPIAVTKSGMMVGLGETNEEVIEVLADLREAGVSAVTIGQYLQPTRRHLPVAEFVPPARFGEYADRAREMGFTAVMSGPLARSSYHAAELMGRGDTPPSR